MSLRINVGKDSEALFIILPGVSQGANSGVLKLIADALESGSKTYLAVTFPFQDKGFNSPESQTFEKEVGEVIRGLDLLNSNIKPKKIVLIGKSFGALIGVKMLPLFEDKYGVPVEFHVLGYIFDEGLKPLNKLPSVFIYQGEKDRYGTPEDVRSKLPQATIYTIMGADHSYRNDNKEPVFERDVLELVLKNIFS